MVTSNMFSPSQVAWTFLPASIHSSQYGSDSDIMGTEERVCGGDSLEKHCVQPIVPTMTGDSGSHIGGGTGQGG